MNVAEYANLDRVERAHWYYAGKRQLVRCWLQRVAGLGSGDLLLDCGAGTGLFSLEMRTVCGVRVLDDHEESLAILRERFLADEVLEGSITRIPMPDASCDCVTALDVLEHVPDDRGAVRDMARVLRPGGVALVTVPALMSLWSEWDVGLHHQRRYDSTRLRALFSAAEWEIVHWNYTNVVVFPALWVVRRWQRWRKAPPGQRVEDHLPPAWLNRFLKWLFVRFGLVQRVKFPAGVSLLLIARRR